MSKRKNPAAVALGRRGGRTTTDRKAAAAQANGRLGGRKPKFEDGDRVLILTNAPTDYRGGTGTIVRRVTKAEYEVASITGACQTTGVLYSWMLEKT